MSFVFQNEFSSLTSFLSHFTTFVSVIRYNAPGQEYVQTPERFVSFGGGKYCQKYLAGTFISRSTPSFCPASPACVL
jgi:hypothetical protein